MEPTTSHLSDFKSYHSAAADSPLDYQSRCLLIESRRRSWNSTQANYSKTPMWSAVVASLLLGNTKTVLEQSGFSGVFRLRQSVRNLYLNLYLAYHKSIDVLFNRGNFNSEIIRLNASGCQHIRTPDAFLEEFPKVASLEVLDNVFKQLPFEDIRNVQLVCKQWRNLVVKRRRQYSKKLIPTLTISYHENSIRTSNSSNSIGMFGGSSRRVHPAELSLNLRNIRFNSLDISIYGKIRNVEQLNIPIIETSNLNIYFYNGFDQDEEKILELIEALNENPYISSISFINFGNKTGFPPYFINYLEILRIEKVSLRNY